MKTLGLLLLTASLLKAGETPYTLHEWGTFTTVSASDGTLLPGLEREEEALPPSVYGLDGFTTSAPAFSKGWSRPMQNVVVKMETPVIYFYTEQPFHAEVKVGFNGGSISQWYPDRSAGEEAPPLTQLPNGKIDPASIPVDFAKTRHGAIAWDIDVIPSSAADAATILRGDETPNWIYPRLTDSALVKTAQGETEKYLFYRGLGNFALPVTFKATADGHIVVENHGSQAVPGLYVFNYTSDQGVQTLRPAPIAPGATLRIPLADLKAQTDPRWAKAVFQEMSTLLQDSGLYRKEADAMVQTWWRSYFLHPGLRVFWIMPQDSLEKILPLDAKPAPAHSTRVLVGRSEILTPGFEAQLRADFLAAVDPEKPNRWVADRFYGAYSYRVGQLHPVVTKDPKTAQR